MHKVDNAVIMAAGTASRFAPLSYETHKALITVKGEVLIERQIRQLKEAGVPEIYIVTGYKSEQFEYLKEKFGVHLVHNSEYLVRNKRFLKIHIFAHLITIFLKILLKVKSVIAIMQQFMLLEKQKNGVWIMTKTASLRT